jgi:hypothetical protein
MTTLKLKNNTFTRPAISHEKKHYHPYENCVYLNSDGRLSIQYSFYDGKWRSDDAYFEDTEFVKSLFDKAIKSKIISKIPPVVITFLKNN